MALCLSILAPAHADAAIESGTQTAGWVSLRVQTDGTDVGFALEAVGPYPKQLAAYLFTDDEVLVSGTTFTVWGIESGASLYARVEGREVDEELIIEAPTTSAKSSMSGTVATAGEPTTFKLLLWGGGDGVDSWSHAITGGPDVAVLGRDAGDGAILRLPRHFDATVNTWVHLPTNKGGVRATYEGAYEAEFQNTFVGMFIPLSGLSSGLPGTGWTQNILTVEKPNGVQSCPISCGWDAFSGGGPRHGIPGRWIFRQSGVGANLTTHGDEVMLAGVDARLPG